MVIVAVLGIAAVQDIRCKSINYLVMAFFYCAIAVKVMLTNNSDSTDILIGICMGGAMILASILSRQAIGMADALVLLGIGVAYGGGRQLSILLFSLIVLAVLSVVLLVARKVDKKTQLPFLPFIYVSYIVICIVL